MNRLLLCLCWLSPLHVLAHDVPVVTLMDTIVPVITCPPAITLTLNPTRCDTAFFYNVSATDNQPGVIITQLSGLASGATFKIGQTLNVLRATDVAGNSASCEFSVRVNNGSFGLLCKNNTIKGLEENCAATISLSDVLEDNYYGCPNNYSIELDRAAPFGNGPWTSPSLSADDLGKNYAYRVNDLISGFKCVNSILIRDIKPPGIQCPALTVPCGLPNANPQYLKDSLELYDAVVQGIDNCGGNVTLNYQDIPEQTDQCDSLIESSVIRSWTATDERNNSSKCDQRIVWKKFKAAQIQFPQNQSFQCGHKDLHPNKTGYPYILEQGRRFDIKDARFCDFTATFKDSTLVTCGLSKLIRRNWHIKDQCSNISINHTQFIDIQDNTAPLIQCPTQPILKTTASANCRNTVNLPSAIITDNCSPISTATIFWTHNGTTDSVIASLQNFSGNKAAVFDTMAVPGPVAQFPIGETLIRYVATDACGNKATCSSRVAVWDDVAPTAVCGYKPIVYLGADGKIDLEAQKMDAGSSDNCASTLGYLARRATTGRCKSNIFFKPSVTFCCEDINDSVAVILRVFDITPPPDTAAPGFADGHYKDCTLYVHVRDTFSAKCIAPADVTVYCRDFDRSLASYGSVAAASCKVLSVFEEVNYAQFDTNCISGTLIRTFKTQRANGQYGGSCSHKITVNYEDPGFYIRFPDDVSVNICSEDNLYGEPEFFGLDCENLKISHEDEKISPVTNGCFQIKRTWRIINSCYYSPSKTLVQVPNPSPNPIAEHPDNNIGPTVSEASASGIWKASNTPLTFSQNSLDFSTLWSEKTPGYTYIQWIKVNDNNIPSAAECGSNTLYMGDQSSNDPDMWGLNFWWDPINKISNLNEGEVSLSISATDDCLGENVRINYLLYLDLDGVGGQETVVSSANLPNNNIIHYNNLNTPNFSGGTPRLFDNRAVPTNQRYGFTLQTTTKGRFKKARVMWNTILEPNQYVQPQIPYGNHRVRWILEDDCGNRKECENNFVVLKSPLPQLNCDTTFRVDINSSCIGRLDFDDVLPSIINYSTPNPNVDFRLKKSDGKLIFPIQNDTSLYYNGKDEGLQYAEVWAKDTGGIITYCTFRVNVVDQSGNCDTLIRYRLSGKILNHAQQAIEEVNVTLHSPAFQQPQTIMANSNGEYTLPEIPSGYAYEIVPEKKNSPLNGVSTYDLVLISKHILGLESLDSPLKMIAADANKSNSITTLDIVELRKLILGIYTELPKVNAWRFIDKSFGFPNPQNPFETAFPEKVGAAAILFDNPFCHFTGIKTGDVNQNASPDAFATTEDRNKPLAWFEAEEQWVEKGQKIQVKIQCPKAVSAYQFTLQHPDLQLLDVTGEGAAAEHFGLFQEATTVANEKANNKDFTLIYKAKTNGFLSDLLHLSSEITLAQAYTPEGMGQHVGLRFNGEKKTQQLLENESIKLNIQPNPFQRETEIQFYLPEAGYANLSICDQNGRVRLRHSAQYSAGWHHIRLQREQLGAAGTYHCHLQTPYKILNKMILLLPL